MKTALFLALSFLIHLQLPAQSKEELAPVWSDTTSIGADDHYPQRIVYSLGEVDKAPVFPGGEQGWAKFKAENTRVKAISDMNGPSGVIYVHFIIESNGNISNLTILRETKLAIFLLESFDHMPRWSPAIKDGQPVAMWYVQPIHFCFE